jgi:glyoxylase I family protein
MKFEHYAINVPDAIAVADWYVAHCGLTIEVILEQAPFTRFLSDDSGRVFWELYSNPQGAFPDYASKHPLEYHLAFAVENIGSEMKRLIDAGAQFVEEVNPEEGTRLIMLRDPFGIALQLCQRKRPF